MRSFRNLKIPHETFCIIFRSRRSNAIVIKHEPKLDQKNTDEGILFLQNITTDNSNQNSRF